MNDSTTTALPPGYKTVNDHTADSPLLPEPVDGKKIYATRRAAMFGLAYGLAKGGQLSEQRPANCIFPYWQTPDHAPFEVCRWNKTDDHRKCIGPVSQVVGGFQVGNRVSVNRPPFGLYPRNLGAYPTDSDSDGSRRFVHFDFLPDAVDAETVYIVEGEIKVLYMMFLRCNAICSAHGAGSAHQTDFSELRNAKLIVLITDNNNAGFAYVREVRALLNVEAPNANQKVIDLTDDPDYELPDGHDIADWLLHYGPQLDYDFQTDAAKQVVQKLESLPDRSGEERFKATTKAETCYKRRTHTTFFGEPGTGRKDCQSVWTNAREQAEEKLTWDEVLDGLLTEVGDGLWARHAGDSQCASTQRGVLKFFGTTAAPELGLNENSYSKWKLYELKHNPTRSPAVAHGLLVDLGCWPDEDHVPRGEPILRPQTKEIRIPATELKKAERPKLKINQTVPDDDYRQMVVDLMLQPDDRLPRVVLAKGNTTRILIDFLRQFKGRSIIVVRTVGGAQALRKELQMEFESAVSDDPKVEAWSSIRTKDDRKLNLPKNCDNPRSDIASGMGLPASKAVCSCCVHRHTCDLRRERERELMSDHLIMTTATLAYAGTDGFGQRDLIIILNDAPESVVRLSTSSRQVSQVLKAQQEACRRLEDSPEFRLGQQPTDPRGDLQGTATEQGQAERADKLQKWLKDFRVYLDSVSQENWIGSVEWPQYALAWLFWAIEPIWKKEFPGAEYRILNRREFGPSLSPFVVGSRADAEVFAFANAIYTTVENDHFGDEHKIPIVSLVHESPKHTKFEVVTPFGHPESVSKGPLATQHVLPLQNSHSDGRYTKTLDGVLNGRNATNVTVVVHPNRVAAILAMEDQRITEVLNFHQAETATFSDCDLVVILGTPGLNDAEVLQKAGRVGHVKKPDARMRVMELPVEEGGHVSVLMRAFEDSDLMIVQGSLLRQKLGNALAGPAKAIVVTDWYVGLPLTINSLVPITSEAAEICRILDTSETLLTESEIYRQLPESAGRDVDRRTVRNYLRECLTGKYTDPAGTKYLELRPIPIAQNPCTCPLYSFSITGRCTDLARNNILENMEDVKHVWWSRADFERSKNVATRTAQLHIAKLIDQGSVEVNGKKGRAVRYRYTQAATTPRRFKADGEFVEAVPPLGWDGKSPLYARAELVRPVVDGFFEGI